MIRVKFDSFQLDLFEDNHFFCTRKSLLITPSPIAKKDASAHQKIQKKFRTMRVG